METPLVKRCRRTVRSGRSLLVPIALGAVVCALLVGCSGGAQRVPTTTVSAPALLVVRDGAGAFGSHAGDGRIVALDPKNGHLLWQHTPDPLPPGARSVGPLLQPSVQDGLVYVPTTYRDPSKPIDHSQRSELEALDAATGQLRWRHEVAPNPDANTDLASAPVAANGVVYLASTVSVMGNGQTQTLHGLVEALDSHSGSVRWSAPLKSAPSKPVVANGQVILLAGPDLVALKTSDGSMTWSFAPPGGPFHDLESGSPPIAPYAVADGDPGPVVAQQLVFVDATEADGNGVGIGSTWFAVKTSDGSLAWRSARSAPGMAFTRPVLNQSGNVLCTSAHSRDSGNIVMGLSTSNGKTLWTMSTSATLSACAAAGDKFYLTESAQDMTARGMLALSSQTGQRLWYTPSTPPAIVSGYAAPPQRDGLAALVLLGPIPTGIGAGSVLDSIAIVQLETGNILWRQDIKAASDLAVTIIGDQVVVPEYSRTSSTPELTLVAYALGTGRQTWVYSFGHA